MLNLKCFFITIIFVIVLCRTESSENDNCEKLIIEGGEMALKKLFDDFKEIKTTIADLKPKCEVHQEDNKIKHKNLPIFDQRFDNLPEKCSNYVAPKDCAAATSCTQRSGIYKVLIEKYSNEGFYVECDNSIDHGDWLLIQRRQDGSVDFFRNWDEYEQGFGDIDGEFFIGLKKLYALTNYNGPQELMIVMEDSNTTSAYAKYESFAIGDAAEFYKLKKIGKYSGTAGDSLQQHVGMKFSTKDRDYDIHETVNCASNYKGGWWYKACHRSNLNGQYGDNTHGRGINWFTFRGHTHSLKYVKMMIRRRRN